VTGADLNAIEEGLLAQMAATKPPLMRLVAMLGRVDGWLTMWVNGARTGGPPEPSAEEGRPGGPPLTAQHSLWDSLGDWHQPQPNRRSSLAQSLSGLPRP
jgi:hypothetical protein